MWDRRCNWTDVGGSDRALIRFAEVPQVPVSPGKVQVRKCQQPFVLSSEFVAEFVAVLC